MHPSSVPCCLPELPVEHDERRDERPTSTEVERGGGSAERHAAARTVGNRRSTSAGVIGAIAGLVVGLLAYPPTALFAVFELGVPATIAGGLVGFVAALIVMAGRRIMRLIVTEIRT
jgi:hypothetical protein